MKSRFVLGIILLGFLFVPLSAVESKLNILLILSDDHSYPHVGCYGDQEIMTPNLDAFAAEGMRFDRAYVTSPQCVPSRASIFTGRSPVAIDMSRFSAPLAREIKTFPEWLRRAGWYTGVAGRNYHMDGAATSEESREIFKKYNLATFPDRIDYVKVAGDDNDLVIEQMKDFLDDKGAGQPFFLQLCTVDPHRPLTHFGPKKHDPAKIKLPEHYPDTQLVREDFARYYDEIAHFDLFFGAAMAELQKRNLTSNTLVVFMGDNGASQFRGKGTLYEFGIHVPLIVRWPGKLKPGSSSSELISGEDLAPTFLEAAGLSVPSEMTGKSFLKVLRNEPFEGRQYIFSERGAHGSGLPGRSADFDLSRVVVSPTHKLIYNAMGVLPYWPVDFAYDSFWKEIVKSHEAGRLEAKFEKLYFESSRPMFELYDLVKDPQEFNNLAGEVKSTEIEKKLKREMQEWMILQRDFLPLPVQPTEGPAAKRKQLE